MPNIPGLPSNASPGVYSISDTISNGASVPVGQRTAVIMGEGLATERIVPSALGSGRDGLNPTYTGTNGADGRHFVTAKFPLVSNRFSLFKNGVLLQGLEQAFSPTSGSFSSVYDYRINITNGRIELQGASLLDQGGTFYTASELNQGDGSLSSLTLEDDNAPTETWNIRCVSVRRDGYGAPIPGFAKFVAQGSVSGVLLDGYGNQFSWQSDGVAVSNGVLSFAISEGGTAFVEGDRFIVKVKGGALNRGDTLIATYIPELDLNSPEFFTDPDVLKAKHGIASLNSPLAIGAQLAFANNPPGVWAVQCAPPVPRRQSFVVETSASGAALIDDLKFSLPLNVLPDSDSNINFFVTDPLTGTESQLLLNKVAFFGPSATASPSSFIFGSDEYSYTVVLEDAVVKEGDDLVITSIGPTSATISSTTVVFDSSDVGREIKILTPATNDGTFTIASVSGGVATISGPGAFTNETDAEFQVIDNTLQTAAILLTDDVALSAGQSLRVTVVDDKDADFFDAGWTAAYESLETIDVNIVVPLPTQTISSILQQGRIHVETMSNIQNKRERVLFTGAIKGLTPDNLIGNTEAAVEDIGILEGIQGDDVEEILAGSVEDLTDYKVQNGFGNTYRVVYFYPDEIVVQLGADRVTLDGMYIAAAAAGYLSGVSNVAIPLTRKVLAGFTILRDKILRPIILDNLLAAGVSVVQPVAGGGRVIWGRTTTASGFPEEEEISIVFIRDQVSRSLRVGFEGFVGSPEDDTLQGSMTARAIAIVNGLLAQKLITNYRNLRVVQDSIDPRQWNVSVEVRPSYAVNWIYIRTSVGNF